MDCVRVFFSLFFVWLILHAAQKKQQQQQQNVENSMVMWNVNNESRMRHSQSKKVA